MEDRVGQQLGNYRLLRRVGQGGFADVYLGEHIHLNTQAAIKVLQVRLGEGNEQDFLTEARTIAHLVHPYIIRVLDFGVQDNTPFLVMDYAPHGTFRRRFLLGKPLPPAPLVPYIKQTAAALQYGHEHNLIHRDVKPENMLLGPNDEVLLSDFGLAIIAHTSTIGSPAETAGTVAYMAPEQLQGKPCPGSDQYALGIVAYEWLTGSCPYRGSFYEIVSQQIMAPLPSLREKVPGIPHAIENVITRAIAKDPQKRFASVKEFSLALEEACLTSQQYAFDLTLTNPSRAAEKPTKESNTQSSSVPSSSFTLTQNSQPLATPNRPSPTAAAQTDYARISTLSPALNPNSWQPNSTQSYSSPLANLPPLEELPGIPGIPGTQTNQPEYHQSSSFTLEQAATDSAYSPRLFAPASSNSMPEIPAAFLAKTAGQSSAPPLPAFTPASRQKRTHTQALIISIVLLFILVSGAGLFMFANRQMSNPDHQANTPKTQPTATTIQKKSGKASSTPTQTVTNAIPDPYASNSTLVLNDPLATNKNQWQEGTINATGGSCQFVAGQGYQLYAPIIDPGACFEQQDNYTNFAYEVQMQFSAINQLYSGAGIAFRSDTSTQYYYFEVLGNGNYTIQICNNGNCTATLDGYRLGKAPLTSFAQGTGVTNTLAVVANGNSFAFFVNHQLVSEVQDQASTYTTGHIGVMATAGNDQGLQTAAGSSPTTVLFTNARLWKLP